MPPGRCALRPQRLLCEVPIKQGPVTASLGTIYLVHSPPAPSLCPSRIVSVCAHQSEVLFAARIFVCGQGHVRWQGVESDRGESLIHPTTWKRNSRKFGTTCCSREIGRASCRA